MPVWRREHPIYLIAEQRSAAQCNFLCSPTSLYPVVLSNFELLDAAYLETLLYCFINIISVWNSQLQITVCRCNKAVWNASQIIGFRFNAGQEMFQRNVGP